MTDATHTPTEHRDARGDKTTSPGELWKSGKLLYTYKETAILLGVAQARTISHLVQAGELKNIKRIGNRRAVPRKSIADYTGWTD